MGGMEGGMGVPVGGATASDLPRVVKRGKSKPQNESPPPIPPKMIKLTKLEQQMYKMLMSLNVPYKLFGQYMVNIPGNTQPFSLDFAYPQTGVGIEIDGSVWHDSDESQQRDQMRDQKLANVGWRILRFKEDAISEHPDAVQDIILKNITESQKQYKKSSEIFNIAKYASEEEYLANMKEIKEKNMSNNLGKIYYL